MEMKWNDQKFEEMVKIMEDINVILVFNHKHDLQHDKLIQVINEDILKNKMIRFDLRINPL